MLGRWALTVLVWLGLVRLAFWAADKLDRFNDSRRLDGRRDYWRLVYLASRKRGGQ